MSFIDWWLHFRPALMAILNGHSPYTVAGIANPPWAFIPLLPLGLLSPQVGAVALFIVGIMAFTYIACQWYSNWLARLLFLWSCPVVICLSQGNLEWLCLLGLILPSPIGILFLAIKPQVGMGVILYWCFQAWHRGKLMRTIAPLIICTLASFMIFGFWPIKSMDIIGVEYILAQAHNTSLWPWSIPLGIMALVIAIWRRDVRFALIASPLLSPHVVIHSWAGAILALSGWPLFAVVGGLWSLVIENILL